jgi:hypothetical protein
VAFPKAPRQEEGQASQEEGEPRKQEERSEKILAAGVLQRKTIPGIPARTSPVQAQPQQPRTTPQGRILPGRVTPRIAPATYVPPARQQPRQEGKVPMRQPIAKAAEDLPPQEEGEVGQRQNKMARQMGELISGREQEAQPEGERMQRPAGQAPQQGGQPGPEKQGTPVQTEGPAPAPAQTRAEALKTKEVAGTAKMPEKEEEFPLPPPPPPEDDVPKPEDYEEAKEGLKRKMTEEEIAANARKGEDEYLEQYAKQNLVWLYEIYKMGGIAREDFLQKVRERIAEEKGAAKEEPSAQNAALANLGKEIDKNIK